jgi:hypothetical protein
MIRVVRIYRLGTDVHGHDSVTVTMNISTKSYKLGGSFNNIDSASIRNL